LNDNIKMHRTKIGCEDMKWIELFQVKVKWLAFVMTMMSLRDIYHLVK